MENAEFANDTYAKTQTKQIIEGNIFIICL